MKADPQQFAVSEHAKVLVVDGSRLVRTMIARVLKKDLPKAVIIDCETGSEAIEAFANNTFDLVTVALRLSDMDGMKLAKHVRKNSPQHYIPIILVSGDTRGRLEDRTISKDITDYFDKSEGYSALATFVHSYVRPDDSIVGKVLYIEDSRVVALATRRMMEHHGIEVIHFDTVEGGLEYLKDYFDGKECPVDIVLSDVYLKGGLTGHDFLNMMRDQKQIDRAELPILVMTGDDDDKNQSDLLKAGANDLVEKPIDENILINKIRFQLKLSQRFRD